MKPDKGWPGPTEFDRPLDADQMHRYLIALANETAMACVRVAAEVPLAQLSERGFKAFAEVVDKLRPLLQELDGAAGEAVEVFSAAIPDEDQESLNFGPDSSDF
jgi:hypothetical protein